LLEAAWIAIVAITAGIAFGVERSRRVEGPSAYWVAAVGAIFAAFLCNFLLVQPRGSRWWIVPEYALFMAYPAILLAGALHISDRRVPGWLVPGAAVVGVLRGLLALFGPVALANAIAVALAPAAAGAAALLVYRTSRKGASLSERLLAPTLLGTALLLVATALAGGPGVPIPWLLLGPWVASIPLVMASGYAAESDRAAEVLRRAREDLEQRVEERTRELFESEERRRQLDQHMQEVQRLESLGVLAGGIAHDFNNVLTVILGNVRLGLEDLSPGAPGRARLERIQAAAEHAQGLTRQMLTYSGRALLTLQPLDLSRLVLDMLDLLRASVAKQGEPQVDLADGLPAVEGDQTQIRQVVLNLAINAAEALPEEGGSIRVRTGLCRIGAEDLAGCFGTPDAAPGEYVALEVSDSGQGIAAGQLARVFEPFFTSKASGRGLGLAAVLGIVRAHRGVIRVLSEPGAGTTFQVLLPASQRAVSEPAPARAPGVRSRASGTVLVVDDEAAVLEVAQAFLERAGFRVLTASGGRAALDLLRARGPEVGAVVLDLVMPEMGGEETFDALRRLRPDLPILLVSGYDKQLAADRFPDRGLAGILYKPYEPEELVERVRRAVEGSARRVSADGERSR
jgi:signal transduction histidine kinase/CheY-like chemotaxis protein